MNPIGVNTFVWYSPVTDADVAVVAPKAKAMGFDRLELPVENPGDWDPARTAEVLAAHGLRASVCAVRGASRRLLRLVGCRQRYGITPHTHRIHALG